MDDYERIILDVNGKEIDESPCENGSHQNKGNEPEWDSPTLDSCMPEPPQTVADKQVRDY